jgi:hypothetical protein
MGYSLPKMESFKKVCREPRAQRLTPNPHLKYTLAEIETESD